MASENIVNYLRETKKRGYSFDNVKLALLKKGWPAQDIDKAWNYILKEENFFGKRFFSLAVLGLLAGNLSIIVVYLLLLLYVIESLYLGYFLLSVIAILAGWFTYMNLKKMSDNIDLITMIAVSIYFFSMLLLTMVLIVLMNIDSGATFISKATIFLSVILYFGFFHALLIKEFFKERLHLDFFVTFSALIVLLVFLIGYIMDKLLF
ncbi:MAG: hypothetical protein QW331_01235 [Candidatus Woesearchaeota archaeon]